MVLHNCIQSVHIGLGPQIHCIPYYELGYVLSCFQYMPGNHMIVRVQMQQSLKRKCRHFDEISITGYTESCHLTTFGAASHKNFVKMTTFLFQWLWRIRKSNHTYRGELNITTTKQNTTNRAHVLWDILQVMMTSSNWIIFRVTGPLCGEFTGPRWIPLTKAGDTELWCFLWSVPELTAE